MRDIAEDVARSLMVRHQEGLVGKSLQVTSHRWPGHSTQGLLKDNFALESEWMRG